MFNSQVNVTVLASCVEGGGAETALFHLLLGLDRERFRPHLVCLRNEPGIIARELQSRGIPLLCGLSRGKFDPLVGYRLMRALGKRLDILYCLDHHNVLFWAPYLLHLVNIRANMVICHQTRDLNGRPRFRITDRPALRRMQRIIVVAHKQKRHLVEQERLPAERIEVIHNGISPADFADLGAQQADRARIRREWGLTEEHRVAIIVALLRPEKNHARFLRVARTVAERIPEARFVVVGDGLERSSLESYARALGIGDIVRFVGIRRDVPRLLAASDVVTLTSDEEAFPLALLEGMAAGRPIIATRVGSLDEMVIEGETGHLIPVDDERSFADALHRVLFDRARAEAMGRAGRLFVHQHFTVEHMVRAHERLFERLLQEASMKNREVRSTSEVEIG